MDDLLRKINIRLQHYNRDELMALIWEYLSDRDVDNLADFLDLMRQKSRPAALEPLELEDADDLLGGIQDLHDAIANDEYVEYGSGYDPDYNVNNISINSIVDYQVLPLDLRIQAFQEAYIRKVADTVHAYTLEWYSATSRETQVADMLTVERASTIRLSAPFAATGLPSYT